MARFRAIFIFLFHKIFSHSLAKVKSIQVHHFGPCLHEVV